MEVHALKGFGANEHAARFAVKVYHSFEDLPPSYHLLFNDMAAVSFSASLPWFHTFVRTAMQEGAALRLYGVESVATEAVARGLLVAQSPAARRGSILRNRRIGQKTLSGLTGYQTYLFAPLLRDEDPDFDEILHCLARHLCNERPRWEMIDFAAMNRDARSFAVLVSALRAASFIVRPYPHFFSVFQPSASTNYTAYRDSRPPWARQRISRYERKERQLKRRYAYRAELITGEAELDRTLNDYEQVYAASWKEQDHHPAFVPACIRACAQTGCLRLVLLYLDERPVASLFVFLTGKRALFYRTAYDPAYAKESVGAIAHLTMIQHLLGQDGVEELDFGRDREPYKQCWASGERVRYGVLAFDCATLGGCLGLAEHTLLELREWLARASLPLRNRLMPLVSRLFPPRNKTDPKESEEQHTDEPPKRQG